MSQVNFKAAVEAANAEKQQAISTAFGKLINKPELTEKAIVTEKGLAVYFNGDDGSGLASKVKSFFSQPNIPVLSEQDIESNDTFQTYKQLVANQGYDVSVLAPSAHDYDHVVAMGIKRISASTAAISASALVLAPELSKFFSISAVTGVTFGAVGFLAGCVNSNEARCTLEFSPRKEDALAAPKLAA